MHRVLLVGSQLSREGLKCLLADSVFTSTSEAKTLDEAHRILSAMHAEDRCLQLMLVDFHGGPYGDDGEILHRIRLDYPGVKVVVLGDPVMIRLLSQICPMDIDGYLLDDIPAVALIHSLHLVALGQKIFPPGPLATTPTASNLDKPVRRDAPNGLSVQERKILELLLVGASNKSIARDLKISEATVKVHMRHILRKVNARNRTEAAIWAVEHGLSS
jgi:two-component system nitrate/nitrite response regulator NarL